MCFNAKDTCIKYVVSMYIFLINFLYWILNSLFESNQRFGLSDFAVLICTSFTTCYPEIEKNKNQ